MYCIHSTCRQTSKISGIKSQNVDVSRFVLQLSLPNPLKPGVKSRMKLNVVGAAPTGDAPIISQWSTILLSTKVWLILEMEGYVFDMVYIQMNMDQREHKHIFAFMSLLHIDMTYVVVILSHVKQQPTYSV